MYKISIEPNIGLILKNKYDPNDIKKLDNTLTSDNIQELNTLFKNLNIIKEKQKIELEDKKNKIQELNSIISNMSNETLYSYNSTIICDPSDFEYNQ